MIILGLPSEVINILNYQRLNKIGFKLSLKIISNRELTFSINNQLALLGFVSEARSYSSGVDTMIQTVVTF